MLTTRVFTALTIAGLSLGPIHHALPAQVEPRMVPVRFMLKQEFSVPGLAAIVRQTGGPHSENIVALSQVSASPEVMYLAITSLTRLISRYGDRPAKSTEIRISADSKLPVLAPADDRRMQQLAERLLAAPRADLPRIGRVRTFTATVPVDVSR